MATYVSNFRIEYNANGVTVPAKDPLPDAIQRESRTLTDGEANGDGSGTFERSPGVDVVSGGGKVPNNPNAGEAGQVTFEGTIVVNIQGVNYTLIVTRSNPNNTQGDYHVFGNVPSTVTAQQIWDAMPPTLNLSSLVTTPFTVCFAAGTLIATPDGERAVETLAIGDMVLTADGRAVPVRWMGRNTVHKATHANFAPVRVTAGALGVGVPHSDLILTGDHALIVDGLAINASALVNGTTIAWEPIDALPDQVTYWHVETEAHDEILANGAPAESFVDGVGRRAFDNHQDYVDLYGAERIIPEMNRARISARRQLPADLAARLGIGSFADAVDAEIEAMAVRLNVA